MGVLYKKKLVVFWPFFAEKGGGLGRVKKILIRKNWGGQKRGRGGLSFFFTKSKKTQLFMPPLVNAHCAGRNIRWTRYQSHILENLSSISKVNLAQFLLAFHCTVTTPNFTLTSREVIKVSGWQFQEFFLICLRCQPAGSLRLIDLGDH